MPYGLTHSTITRTRNRHPFVPAPSPLKTLKENKRMSIRRWGRTPKTRAQKGNPGTRGQLQHQVEGRVGRVAAKSGGALCLIPN